MPHLLNLLMEYIASEIFFFDTFISYYLTLFYNI